ncbi:MAG: M4 family metallopeptidase, partial [Blastocatellia bacterium]
MKRKFFLFSFLIALLFTFTFIQSNKADSKKYPKLFNQDTKSLAIAKSFSLYHLTSYLSNSEIKSEDLKEKNIFVDELAMAHTKFQQTHQGIPVFGGETIVHLNADGSLFTITDSLVDKINVDTNATISEQEAIEKAIKIFGCNDCLTKEPKVDMFILQRKSKDYLTYRVQLERIDNTDKPVMPVYFIDAHTGKKVWEYDNLQTASATVSGTSTYYGNLSFTGYQNGSTFYLEDVGRKVGIFNFNNTTTSISRTSDTDNVYNATNQRSMIDAFYGTTKTYDYFKNVHGRNGLNGAGGPGAITSIDGFTPLISSIVHYGNNVNNAFWDGTNNFVAFGDGDGVNFSSLTTLDICGHELTHGITQFTANLTYSGESGALNESMSDVFGVMVDRYVRGENANTYRIAEECFTPGNGTGDALRYMDSPHLAGNGGFTSDDDPDHYSERYTGTADNGGVHINSGIANKAFHLVAKGGSHHLGGSMVGIGADQAAAIWYKALTTYMTSSTNFAGARVATLNAASVLYGQNSTQYNAVAQAWNIVGVNPPSTSNKDTIGTYTTSTSTFNLRNSNTAGQANLVFGYGAANAGWIPIAGDWNGDGIDTIGLYAPSTSTFYLRNSNTGG